MKDNFLRVAILVAMVAMVFVDHHQRVAIDNLTDLCQEQAIAMESELRLQREHDDSLLHTDRVLTRLIFGSEHNWGQYLLGDEKARPAWENGALVRQLTPNCDCPECIVPGSCPGGQCPYPAPIPPDNPLEVSKLGMDGLGPK